MKRLYRTIIQALFILTAAAAGLRAQQGTGTVTLPELSSSTALSMNLISASLTIHLVSDSYIFLPFFKTVTWRDGAWIDKDQNKVSSELQFPIKILEEKPEIKARYKLDYDVTYLKDTSPVSIKFSDYLPAEKAGSFNVKADFPLQPVIIDGSGLVFSNIGLRGVDWKVSRQIGMNNVTDVGALKNFKNKLWDGTPTNKTGVVTVDITFSCARGRKIAWANNGKDLRKLAPDLVLKLSQPACK